MRIAVFSAKSYDREFLERANSAAGSPHELVFHEMHLEERTARIVQDADAVCPFVNDVVDRATLEVLCDKGVGLISLRCAGFNNVDLLAAEELGIAVARVPAYSPNAVAEHAVALLLSLVRHIHRAYARVREGNFSLEGLLGFDLVGRTVGIVGTGRIGMCVARILEGFGCHLLAFDPITDPAFPGEYVAFDELLRRSDVITLHCPLNAQTHHLIDQAALTKMKTGVAIINTSRGAVIDSRAIIVALKSGKIGLLGLDVYEEEEGLFFEDLSAKPITDDVLVRLMTFPNVLITGHQGFFTMEAMQGIAEATVANASAFEQGGTPQYPVTRALG